ncbi:MAG: carbohydrate ABC transporter substrate-binding protein [Sphaerochaetaceae bacterium]|nr:carbohydrate ABC transporter substrate-binding protein [Sphaerochaetaceae bacterium]
MKNIMILMVMVLGVSFLLVAAGSQEVEDNGMVELVIPHYKAGQNVGGKFFLPQVDRFNALYDGTYRIVIEELPQDGYQDKIKLLAQMNKLPALIEGVGDTVWFEDYMLANDRVQDLKPWLDTKPHVKGLLLDDALEYNTRDGKIVSLPLALARPIGLFYNNTMINPSKPIGEMTHEEFLDMLGDQKIAFMTSENAWTTNLFYTSLIAAEPGGVEMLQNGVEEKIYDYTGPIWREATTNLQKVLQDYASGNTLGAAYADAANSFMSRRSAVIPNGPWMVGDFAPDSEDKWSNGFSGDQVSGDVYPGNFAIANVRGYNWWIPNGLPERELEAALAFLEFMMSPDELEAFMLVEGGVVPKLTLSEDFLTKQKKNPILVDLATTINKDTRLAPLFGDVVPGSIGNMEFGKLLPKLIDGTFTPQQFCEELTLKAAETRL